MDKYLITSFKSEIATAILNSQEKLNPNKDAYIDSAEMPAILDFFGVDDVNKLLKDTQTNSESSVFTSEQQTEAAEENEDQQKDYTKYTELMDPNNTVLRNNGSAGFELQNNIAHDILTSSVGTPYEAQMKSLYEEKRNLLKKGEDTSTVEDKINALKEAVEEYIKIHQKDITKTLAENEIVTEFNYGKNGEKKGYYVQTFNVKANNTLKGSEEKQEESDSADNSEEETKQTFGGITYNIDLATERLHAIGHIDADNENSDIIAVGSYNNLLKNGGKYNITGAFRQTIEKNHNKTSFGASFDYSKNKFATGAYASYDVTEEEEGEDKITKSKTFSAEGYAKYGNTFRGAIGYSTENNGTTTSVTKYATAKIAGKRELNNSNITLTGSLEGQVGVTSMNTFDTKDVLPVQSLNAKGGLSFTSSHSDLSGNILANVGVLREQNAITGYETGVNATLLGNVSNDKIDVTTTLSATNTPNYELNEDTFEINSTGRKTEWSSSITVGLKKIFGKNVIPSFTYNISSGEKVKHNMAVNLGINF